MDQLKAYKKLQPVIYSGDLIEWRASTALGAAIRWFTKQDVNHSSLVVRFDYHGLADRRFIFEAMAKGLEFNLLSERLKEFKGLVFWYGLRPSLHAIEQVREKMKAKALLLKAEHKKYDYYNLFKNAAVRVSVNAREVFCSEFYQICGMHAGIFPDATARRPGEFGVYGVHLPRVEIWRKTD